ncbi:MAG: hypothetical protein AB7O49_09220 [Sphingomonadales bacterium]
MDFDSIFRAASSRFDAAYARGGTPTDYLVGGRPVRIRVAGAALAEEIDLPLRHLRTTVPAMPELAIDLWDQGETGVDAVMGPPLTDALPFGNVSMSDDRRFLGEQRPSGALWYDRRANRVVGSVQDLKRRMLDERARPFHRFFCVWLADHGIQFVHSGLIARTGADGRPVGMLFVGMGGTGKTTSSIACFRAGLAYLGDDAIGIEQAGDGFVGHGFYASCLIDVDHIRRFPDLQARSLPPLNDYEEKAVVYLAPIDAARVESRVRIAAVVLPRILDQSDTAARPVSKGRALLSLAPSSIMQLPITTHGAIDRLADLIARVPTYCLELGRDVEAIPAAVNALFDSLETAST